MIDIEDKSWILIGIKLFRINLFDQFIVSSSSKPLATIVEALAQENHLSRLERTSKLIMEAKMFFQKVKNVFESIYGQFLVGRTKEGEYQECCSSI